MYKKSVIIFWVVSVVVCGNVTAAGDWTNAADDNLWSNGDNWDNGETPFAVDDVSIDVNNTRCVIKSSLAAYCRAMRIARYGRMCWLEINGGSLSTTHPVYMGVVSTTEPGHGIITLNDGSINCDSNFNVGWDGRGTLNIIKGTLVVSNYLNIPGRDGEGKVNLKDGVIEAGNLNLSANGSINIAEGSIILEGDKKTLIEGYISDGLIKAYGGRGVVTVDYDSTNEGKTTIAGKNSRDINRIDQMPSQPYPYFMRDWKQVAKDFDRLVFEFNSPDPDSYTPIMWIDDSNINYYFDGFGLDSYVGKYNSGGNAREAICAIPAVAGASLVGIDKTNQNGYDFVKMCHKLYNIDNGEGVVLNNTTASSANNFNYTVQPNLYFFQLADKFWREYNFYIIMKNVADKFYNASVQMGGTDTSLPDYNHSSFDFRNMVPVDNGLWTKPDAAGGFAWICYSAYNSYDYDRFLQGAEWGIEWLQSLNYNPQTHVTLAFGALTAAKMNAEKGYGYEVDKLLNWVFSVPEDGDARPGWGIMAGEKWGGYDADGLVGHTGNDYAFAYETFQTAGTLAPLPRYNASYACDIGKWMLNLANSARLYYGNFLDADHQSCFNWVNNYDPNGAIPYEALRGIWEGNSPYIMGDSSKNDWDRAYTDLCPYGGASVGMLAAVVEKTNTPKILQLDLTATDFHNRGAYPTFLYYNPYTNSKNVQINLGTEKVDVYDTVNKEFVLRDANGLQTFTLSGDSAIVLVLTPVKGTVTFEKKNGLKQMLIDNIVVDYHASETALRPLPFNNVCEVNTDVTLKWNKGLNADSHDVYLGTDYTQLANRTRSSSTFMGNQTYNSYNPSQLSLNTTYYWAVDEIADGIVHPGQVWSFTTDSYWKGDLNRDGSVNISDLDFLQNYWLSSPPDGSEVFPDTDGDGFIDFVDFSALAEDWDK